MDEVPRVISHVLPRGLDIPLLELDIWWDALRPSELDTRVRRGRDSQFRLYEVEVQADNGSLEKFPIFVNFVMRTGMGQMVVTYSAMSMPHMPVPHPKSRMRGDTRFCIGALK